MCELLSDEAALEQYVRSHPICLVYFSTPDCGVCAALKPKLGAMLEQRFPKIAFAEVDCSLSPSLAAGYSVFSVPTLIVFTQGKESLRKSRSLGLGVLAGELERPYSLVYGGN